MYPLLVAHHEDRHVFSRPMGSECVSQKIGFTLQVGLAVELDQEVTGAKACGWRRRVG
jgi:hypothetical protein